MRSDPLKSMPSKLYYSISEVAKVTGVKAHVLRYWEGEFPTLRPKKTRSGARRYRRVDIEEVLAIKSLLYDEGFKIAGARKMRRQAKKKAKEEQTEQPAQMALGFAQMSEREKFAAIKAELQDVLEMIRGLAADVQRTVDADRADEAPEAPKKQMRAEA